MKKYLLLITSLLLCFSSYAQTISGKYQRIDVVPGIEESTVINFEKNYSFEEVTKKHLETSTIKNGSFKIKGDTLILNFDEPEQKDFVITKKNKISESDSSEKLQTNIFLKIHYQDEKHSETIIHFNDKNEKIFIGTTINESNVFSIFNDKIKSLKISSLGKNDIDIDLAPILGYSSTIDIYLSKVKYESTNLRKQKFLIEKLKNGNIKLAPISNGDFWILEKV